MVGMVGMDPVYVEAHSEQQMGGARVIIGLLSPCYAKAGGASGR